MSIEKVKRMIDSGKYHVGNWGDSNCSIGDELKQSIVDLHYETNMSMYKLSDILNLSQNTLSVWKKKYGKQLTGIKYNKRIQYDVRTKCIIVAEALTGKTKYEDVAKKYNIGYSTLMSYIKQYRYHYNKYIDELPDGVPYMVKEEKMIYGTKNVLEAREAIKANLDVLKNVLSNIELTKGEKSTIESLVKKEESKELEINNAIKTLEKHGIKI